MVVVINDSAADLTPREAEALGIDLVPTILHLDGSDMLCDVDISQDDFYERFARASTPPSTEPPPAEAFEAAFKRRVDAGYDVVCIVISSKISKTYANAQQAAQRFGGRVHVVDTKTLSGGEALLSTSIAEMARSGADLASVVSAAQRQITSQRGYAAFPNFDVLARTGRIDKSQILLGTMMKLFPVIRIDEEGSMHSEATVKSFELAVELIIDLSVRKMRRKNEARIAVTHIGAPSLAQRVASDLRTKLGVEPKELTIRKAGIAIACNLGLGAIQIHVTEA